MTVRKFAFLGCGVGSGLAKKALSQVPGLQCVGAVDTVPGKAEAFLDGTDGEAFEDPAAMYAAVDPDVVQVSVPSGAHKPLVVDGLGRGKIVLCDKPTATTRADIQACVEADPGGRLFTYSQCFFSPGWQFFMRAANEGRFGRFGYGEVHSFWSRGIIPPTENYYDGWHGNWPEDGGGAIANQGIHSVDCATRAVAAMYRNPRAQVFPTVGGIIARNHFRKTMQAEDTARVTFPCDGNAELTILGTTAAVPERLWTFNAMGTDGSVIINQDGNFHRYEFAGDRQPYDDEAERLLIDPDAGDTSAASDPAAVGSSNHALMLNSILAALDSGSPQFHPLAGAEGAWTSLKLRDFYELCADPFGLREAGFVA